MYVSACGDTYVTIHYHAQFSAHLGMFQVKCFSARRFKLQYHYPIMCRIPWCTDANTETCIAIYGTVVQVASCFVSREVLLLN